MSEPVGWDEEALSGGNVTGAVRVGGTVRRAMGPWSGAVHGLLRHLEAREFDGAPRFQGVDAQGREILTYIAGEVGAYPLRPYMWSDAALAEMARLLRRLHDATADYVPLSGIRLASWQLVYPDPARHEVICHNDAAPYNTVFVDGRPRALIDFDVAGPGPRIWDVAYAVYTWVPLSAVAPRPDGSTAPYDAALDAPARVRRLHLFCDAYGLAPAQRGELLETVERRLEALCATLIERAAVGDAAYRRMIDEGHLDHYRREIAFIRAHSHQWGDGPACPG